MIMRTNSVFVQSLLPLNVSSAPDAFSSDILREQRHQYQRGHRASCIMGKYGAPIEAGRHLTPDLPRTQIMPSVTPLTNLNSGFRVYEVDSGVRPIQGGRPDDP